MKTVTETNINVWYVISEPGDATRYDYMVIKNYDDFMFVPGKSTFRFPQRINIWDVNFDGMSDEEIEQVHVDIAERENCNPWTVKECVRTMKELNENA